MAGHTFKVQITAFVLLFYACTIPWTRFLMGVHSLDQIVYGLSLGIWSSLTSHFFIRDNLAAHIASIHDWQTKRRTSFASLDPSGSFSPTKPALIATIAYVLFLVATALVVVRDEAMIKAGGPDMQLWAANYKKGCGDKTMSEVFTGDCLKGAGLMILPWALYISMLIKGKVGFAFPEENQSPGCLNGLKRLVAFLAVAVLAAIPALISMLAGLHN